MKLALVLLALTSGEDSAPAKSFQRDVRPILQVHCAGCHQPAKAEADVVVTSFAGLLETDDLVVPGKPAESLLLEVVTPFEGDPPSMPKDADPLSSADVGILRDWILEGALDDTPTAALAAVPEVYERTPIVAALAFSPDGSLLAVPGRGEVLLHRTNGAEGSEIVARLAGLSERIESLAFAPDGTRLAVAGGVPARLGELQVWDTTRYDLLLSLPVTFDTIHGASWSSDGTRIAFGCSDNTLRVIDAETGEQVLYQGAHDDWVLDTTFSTDASHLISVGRDRSMKLTQVSTQQFVDNITSITPGALKGGLLSVERHPTKDELLVGGADGIPKIYRMYREKRREIGDDFNLIRAFDKMPGRVFSTAWSPDATRIVAGSSLRGEGEVRSYLVEDGARAWSRVFPSAVYAVAVHPSEPHVAVAGFDGFVRLLDAHDGSTLSTFPSVPLLETSRPVTVEASAKR